MGKKNRTELPEKQLRALTLLEDGHSFDDIAEKTGTTVQNIENLVNQAVESIPKEELDQRFPSVYMRYHRVDAMDLDTEVMAALKEAGIPKQLLHSIQKRLVARKGGELKGVKALTDRDLIAVLKEKIALTLAYLDEFALAGSSAKELAAVVDALIKNAQLMEGKPTAITSVEDRRRINELLPLLMQEAKKRGVTIEGEAERIIEPPRT